MTWNWIRASEAVRRLSSYQGGDAPAAQLIEERVMLGMLWGRALRRVETQRRYMAPDETIVIENEQVPSWMWDVAHRDKFASRSFDWCGERYTAWKVDHPKDQSIRLSKVEFIGLEFREDQITELLPANGAAPTASEVPTGGRSGRPVSKQWPLFMAELALWIEEANDNVAGITAGQLINKLNQRLAEKGFDEIARSTAEPTVKTVLSALQRNT